MTGGHQGQTVAFAESTENRVGRFGKTLNREPRFG